MTKDKTRETEPTTSTPSSGKSLVTVTPKPKATAPKRKQRVLASVMLIAVLGIGGAWWGLGGGSSAPVLAVETLQLGSIKRVLAVSGRTTTDTRSDIVPSVSARVLSVKVNEGDTVEADQTLITLDSTTQQATVRQALASLDSAIVTQQSAQADRDRTAVLGANASAVALQNAERSLALAKADVDRAQAALDQAQIAIGSYQIIAPINGVVLSRSVEPGDLVTPSSVLIRIADTDNLYVEAQIDEIYAGQIHVGQTAQLQLAGRSEIVTGKVSFIASEVDELTGSLRAKLAFDTPPEGQIGLTTVANILIDEVPNVLTVPRTAFVQSDNGTGVLVVRDGKAVRVPIGYVDWPASRVEVTSGLAAGDQVIQAPDGLTDGDPVVAQSRPAAEG